MKSQSQIQSPPRQDDVIQHALLPMLSLSMQTAVCHLRSLRWAERFGLLPTRKAFLKAAQIQVDELAQVTYPTRDPVVAQICTDVLLWFFLADDQFDERVCGWLPDQMNAVAARFMAVLQAGDAQQATCPLSRALLDLRERLLQRMPRSWLLRFSSNMRLYLLGCIQESVNRANGVTPSREEYRGIRRASVGTYPCFDIIELTLGQPISAALDRDPRMAELRDVATDIIAWVNDIVSFRKESAFHDPHNLISVLMAEQHLDTDQATQAAHALIRLRVTDWERLQGQAQSDWQDAGAMAYIDGLRAWIDGVQSWSYRSRRYSADYLQLSQDAKYELLANGMTSHASL